MIGLFKEDSSLEKLSNHFETLLLRLESGQSLRQSLQDAPTLYCPRKWADRWIPLRERLLEGRSQALPGLRSFHKSLLMEQKLYRLLRKKVFMPLFQATSVVFSSLLLLIFTQLWGDEIFKLDLKDYLIEASLLIGGIYWIYRLVRLLFEDLWYLDWIDFVSSIDGQMAWGQNLLSAWKNVKPLQKRLPPRMCRWLEESYESARNYRPLSVEQIRHSSSNLLEHRCCERWIQVHQLFVRNEAVRMLIHNELESSYQRFEYQLEIKSEKLAAHLMLPLFVCFLPASLYVVLAPLIKLFI